MDLSGYFIRKKSEYTGFNMDVGIVTLLSNYIVRVLKQPGGIVYVSPPSKHSALGVILTPKTTQNATFGVSSYVQNLNTLGSTWML